MLCGNISVLLRNESQEKTLIMLDKWLKNDWTLAHFLYYITQFSYIGIVVYVMITSAMLIILWQNGTPGSHPIPVQIEVEQFTEYNSYEMANMNFYFTEELDGSIRLSSSKASSAWPIFGFFMISLFKYAILFSILFLLNRIIKTVIDEEPFIEKNATYLFATGWVLVLTPVAYYIFNYFAQSYFAQLSFPDGFRITSLDNYGEPFIIAGIFMFILGYVFREGNRLYEEQKLTV